MTEVILDVREPDEYAIQHVKDSINVPLSNFIMVAPGLLNQLTDRKIQFMCHSGSRAQQAFEQAKGLGFDEEHTYSVYPGGLKAWMDAGKDVQKAAKSVMPLMRQMQVIMGVMFVVFASLGTFVDPLFSAATIVFALGLFYAGLTGDCAVAGILAKASWNKADPKMKDNYCRSSGNCD
jgi:rhodanese-related sulfurtransferase